MPRKATASFELTNTGGLATQYLLSGTGFVSVGFQQGTLNPGQSVTVTIAPGANLPDSEVSSAVNVLGPNPLAVLFVVQ